MFRDKHLGSSEARDPAKFMTVVRNDENLAIRGSHMQLQLRVSDFSVSGNLLHGWLISASNREQERLLS